MTIINVNTSAAYQVKIGGGLLPTLGQEVSQVCNAQVTAILCDSNVWPLYGKAAADSLAAAGMQVVHFVFPAGEYSKNGQTYLAFLNFLAENKLTRSDCIIALGGGVVGDMGGFAAATFLRGIPYIQVPTTLLAAVDSSVGGKTAIDLDAGKNLAGAFYQPRLVLCDTDLLHTLPEDIFRDGCAEVIKYGVLFAHLAENGLAFDRQAVIARCVELKRDVVIQDEFDTGARQLLNLGHTVGHGIEAVSHFEISHGKAVAAGMAIVSRAAVKGGILNHTDCERLITVLQKFGLPTSADASAQALYECALSDKKRSGGAVNLVIPQEIGHCILQKIPVSALKKFIEAGL